MVALIQPSAAQQPETGCGGDEPPLLDVILQAAAFAIDAVPAAGEGAPEAASAQRTGSAALERVIGPLRGPLAVARSPQKPQRPEAAPGSAIPGLAGASPAGRRLPSAPLAPGSGVLLLSGLAGTCAGKGALAQIAAGQQAAPPEAVTAPSERELLLIDIGLVCRRRRGAGLSGVGAEAAAGTGEGSQGGSEAVAVRCVF